MSKSLLMVVAVVLAVGCQKTAVRKEMIAMGPVILPNSMCAMHGTVAMSTDKEGERMLCELQEQIGTHLPRCVCWDEGYAERERELAMEQMRGLSSLQACGGGDGAAQCMMGVISGSSR
jgi:hypothetical protein